MAELTSFSYTAGDSTLHRLDARFKIAFMVIISLVCLNAYFRGLGILTLILLGVILRARLPLASGLREMRYFLVLLLLIFAARVLSTDGTPLIDLKYFTLSRQGIYDGIIVCWRLVLIVILGFAFIATTPPSAIKAAVQWFLKPLPLVPEKKVAVMMGLLLRFVPVILNQAGETAAALKARAVENRKNPLYRLTRFGFPLMRRTFERADDLVVAMEARAFTENRTDPELTAGRRDWIALLFVCCLCVSMIAI
jgi:energy-coupling factor transporter transmembrane protein EcfT